MIAFDIEIQKSKFANIKFRKFDQFELGRQIKFAYIFNLQAVSLNSLL